jgi:hypothetical protein
MNSSLDNADPNTPSNSSNPANFSLSTKRKLHPDFIGKRPIEFEPLYSNECGNISASFGSTTTPAPAPTTTANTITRIDTICPICRDSIQDAHRAKCGHEACYGCWTEWLSRTLECPLCRQRIRIPQLRK